MANFQSVYPTLPVTDLARSRQFYETTLGLTVTDEVGGGLVFKVGDNSQLFIYQREPSPAAHTLAGFRVDDIDAAVDDLASRGVQFEHYDTPYMKTNEKGISDNPPIRAAWFKDPDGNTLGVVQRAK